ncbi:MAG TPA: multicopper oxidase domain-containing protein [Mycobacterium sp.]|nr:multicopper oxidase domain-containing protein [Mycobacterium sp.]
MLTRRQFIKRGAAGAGGIMVGNVLLQAGAATAVAPTANLTSYMMPFAVPPAVALGAGDIHAFTAKEITRQLHPQLAGATHPWSYDDGSSAYSGYLGPTIVVHSGSAATLTYSNGLPATYPFPRIPVDRNLTDGDNRTRIIGHLHGAFDSGLNDGNPAASSEGGVLFGDTQSAFYPNNQRATLLWYHDHATGATRLNVFAGLAGGYVIRDAFDTGGPKNPGDPNPWMPFGYGIGAGKYEIPLVIQDRQFNAANGDFLYPTMPPGAGTTGECGDGLNVGGYPNTVDPWPNSTGPWIGEYFGDEMLVNGVCSPVLDVEPAIYRFRILNGCNARFLNLTFQNVGPGVAPPPTFVQIGAEQGLFKTPVTLGSLPMVNAERADVIVDFRRFAGQELLLRNANMPKPYATPAPRLQDIMKFRVSLPSTQANNAPLAAVPTGAIDGGEVAGMGLGSAVLTRQIVLQEWNAGLPGWHLTLSPYSVDQATLPAVAPITTPDQAACFHTSRSDILQKGFVPEEPKSGTVEEWEFYNYTADTHPMHMHLTRFQLVDRRPIGTRAGGAGTVAPAPWEQGWKDTVAAHPGMVTRIRQKFDLPNGTIPNTADATYVYHCHIVEHEDNDMMRPFIVVA